MSHWLALVAGAALVAASIGAIALAVHVDVPGPAHPALAAPADGTRRRAHPGAGAQRFELPMVSISRVHVAVDVDALASGTQAGQHWTKEERVRVVLDTGASLGFGTADAGLRFPLRTAPGTRGTTGFAGERGVLFPLEHGEQLSLSLLSRSDPRTVLVSVRYLAPTTLHGADIVAPPEALAPIGGAVLLDFERHVFIVCESIGACRAGGGWHALDVLGCPGDPDTVPVSARFAGKTAHLRLDTGAATLLFRSFYSRSGPGKQVTEIHAGSLTGIGNQRPDAKLLAGHFRMELGAAPPLVRSLDRLWVVRKLGKEGPAGCARDGSLGTDALAGCQLVLGERAPHRGFVRCGDAAHAQPP